MPWHSHPFLETTDCKHCIMFSPIGPGGTCRNDYRLDRGRGGDYDSKCVRKTRQRYPQENCVGVITETALLIVAMRLLEDFFCRGKKEQYCDEA